MPARRILLVTLFALIAFAGNSLLCRAALAHTQIDAASFTTIRLVAGAFTLWLLLALRQRCWHFGVVNKGDWLSALALFVYAAGFSFAYIQLNTGVGALILFAAVQVSMIAYGLWRGERFAMLQWLGFIVAFTGLVALLLPGVSAPSLDGALLMIAAGIAWGGYSLRGKTATNPLQVTAGNFVRTVPFALLLSLIFLNQMSLDSAGVGYALVSGAVTSALGYAIWYSVLPHLTATTAATVQLSVPLLAAVAGIILLQESVTLRILFAAVAIVGGIALVTNKPRREAG